MAVDSRHAAGEPNVHFISGLPRSGSTLLAAILNQNPRFHAGMTSPLGDMVGAMVSEMSGKNEFSIMVSDGQRADVIQGLVRSFYRSVDTHIIFDTSRVWCSKMPLLATLFPHAKVMACVRELPWILDSVERLVRAQPLGANKMFRFEPFGTVYSRIEAIIDSSNLVGFSFQATKDAFYGEFARDRLVLLTYESMTRNPKASMQMIYKLLGEPWFDHDFDHVEYSAVEFDARLGLPGLHTVRPKVTSPQRQSVLPPDLFNRFAKDSFWLDPKNNIRGVLVI